MKAPRSSSRAGLRDKMSRTCGHTHEKANEFLFENWNGWEAILRLSRLDCLSAKTDRTVNGGAFMRRSSWPLTGSAGFAILPANRIYYFFLISFNFIFLLSAIFLNTSATYEHCALKGSADNSSLDCICFIASCNSESSNKLTATQKKFFLRPSL